MKLRIGAYEHTVRTFRDDERQARDLWGEHDQLGQEILIHPAASPARQLATLLHESVHAMWDAHGLTSARLSEEQVATFIGQAFAALILANPHFLHVLRALANGATFQGATDEH